MASIRSPPRTVSRYNCGVRLSGRTMSNPASERELQALVDLIGELNGGDIERARRWLDLPLSDFGGQTARQLVEAGHVEGVRNYVISLQSGSVG